mmetsp:Transcript_697/g.1434  ORF Transcript_697/g.1434 Transcript_697/m.1434 type:complete len:203 (-) Transcript_697:74-682(-)|eukprot:CAMPEP_0119058610 /NCGR_PEP_ID=MMETSP1178-20130426/2889_1 /TAXON_ID=33656 /ORGANISM="unid sp, Strain CCMP2000" /LENGTH=202 /DNA_ID=CAMNT_0007039567 /DNA_START=82 /DNA_END=690 /DNA_ORIENTATION=+
MAESRLTRLRRVAPPQPHSTLRRSVPQVHDGETLEEYVARRSMMHAEAAAIGFGSAEYARRTEFTPLASASRAAAQVASRSEAAEARSRAAARVRQRLQQGYENSPLGQRSAPVDNVLAVHGEQQVIEVAQHVDPLTRGMVLGDNRVLTGKPSTRPQSARVFEPDHATISDNSLYRMLTPAPLARPRTAPVHREWAPNGPIY